ncbi:MAG: TonB-dependent receptor [Rhodospirillaceae bacterium]
MKKFPYLGRASLFGATALSLISVMTAEVAAQFAIEEITVTARKRDESLREVPLSITAITSNTIAERGVYNFRDIVNLTPALTLSEFGAGTLNFPTIRGLTNLTAGGFAENNVSVFYNGAFLPDPNIVDVTFLDVERIEIVKGPVSALYGRNAFSGVINYVTKRPSDELGGYAQVIAGSDGRYGAQASVSGQVVEGVFGLRLAGRFDDFGGTWEDDTTGTDFGGYKKRAIQLGLEFDPAETVNIFANLLYSDDRYDLPARVFADGNCGAAPGAVQPVICGKVPNFTNETKNQTLATNPSFDQFGNDRETFIGTLDTNIEIGSYTLKSQTTYLDNKRKEIRDQDLSSFGQPFSLLPTANQPAEPVNLATFFSNGQESESFQQELRLSSAEDEAFRWAFGGFYAKFDSTTNDSLLLNGENIPAGRELDPDSIGFVPGFPLIAPGDPLNPDTAQLVDLEDREYSLFGVMDFDATDALTVSAEARWTDQSKFQNSSGTSLAVFFGDNDGPDGIEADFNFWSFRFTADYTLADDSLVYVSAAKGNKAGGFNASTTLDPVDLIFGPEVNWTYEVGYKTLLLDDRLSLDAAVFYSDLSDLQLNGFTVDGLGSVIRNAGEARAYGFELDVTAFIADGVTLRGGIAYTDPEFKQGSILAGGSSPSQCRNIPACADRVITNDQGRAGLDLAGLSLPRQSDWTGTLNLDVVQPLMGDWNWAIRSTYRYESRQFATTPQANVGFVGTRHNANIRAGAETEGYSITAYVNNLFNDGTPYNYGIGLNAATNGRPIAVVYGDRRTFGVEARINF